MGDSITMNKDIEKLLDSFKGLVKITKNQDKMIASLTVEVSSLSKDVEGLKKRATKLEKRTTERIF